MFVLNFLQARLSLVKTKPTSAKESLMTNRLNSAHQGSLEVVCGPMFSGKSEELIRLLRRAHIAKQKVLVFKHRFDDRYHSTALASHDGNTVDAIPVANVCEMQAFLDNNPATVIGIDEVQFFSKNIVSLICEQVNAGKRVIVAGLDLDFRGVPFGCMPLLLAIADKVTKLQAICTLCGGDAHFTQRLINGVPANYSDPVIVVGTHESYQARCRACHVIDKIPTFNEHQYNEQNTL